MLNEFSQVDNKNQSDIPIKYLNGIILISNAQFYTIDKDVNLEQQQDLKYIDSIVE